MAELSAKVVDISSLVKVGDSKGFKQPAIKTVCQDLVNELSQVGCVLISNHEITTESIDEVQSIGSEFFARNVAIKKKYSRHENTFDGWTGTGSENLFAINPTEESKPGPGDLQEAYGISDQHNEPWPDADVPGFKKAFVNLFTECRSLTQTLLKAIAVGLDLEDVEVFSRAHLGESNNQSALRFAFYPAIMDETKIKAGQMRCAHHSDFDSITLFFQDGGLEVLSEAGQWWEPQSVPGTILVLNGDYMPRWTGDRMKTTVLRVEIPSDEKIRKMPRKSLNYYASPDDEWMVETLTGSNNYPPIKTADYLHSKLSAMY
eukprot:GHVO01057218.1.p1 GENE.GHVO01057218.1~~GHVO01057218.1.p1  ORF type:complete len:333 (+),score=24.54 GHVO01057218.1:47-1000(+)